MSITSRAASYLLMSFFLFINTSASATFNSDPMILNTTTILDDIKSENRQRLAESISAISASGRVDPALLLRLRQELRNGSSDTREEIAYYLVELGRSLDRPAGEKERSIKDKGIVRVLLADALSKQDAAAGRVEEQVLQYCTGDTLAEHKSIILDQLTKQREAFVLIAAKAKISEARPLIAKIVKTADLDADQKIKFRIALAALGDTSIEESYLSALTKADKLAPPAPKNSFYEIGAAKDGRRAAELIKTLGYIGTRRSLIAICGYLRSDLKVYNVDLDERSVRFDAVDALGYNFPDETVFRTPWKHEHWQAIERFCVTRLGANFDGPTPEPVSEFLYRRHYSR